MFENKDDLIDEFDEEIVENKFSSLSSNKARVEEMETDPLCLSIPWIESTPAVVRPFQTVMVQPLQTVMVRPPKTFVARSSQTSVVKPHKKNAVKPRKKNVVKPHKKNVLKPPQSGVIMEKCSHKSNCLLCDTELIAVKQANKDLIGTVSGLRIKLENQREEYNAKIRALKKTIFEITDSSSVGKVFSTAIKDECSVSKNPQSLDVKLSSLRQTMNQDLILVLGTCGTPDLNVLRVAQFSVIPESGNIKKEMKRYIEYSGSLSMSKMAVRSRKVRARSLMEVCKFFANPNFRSKRSERSTPPEASDPQSSSLEPNPDPTEHTEPRDQPGDLVQPDIEGTPSETDNLKILLKELIRLDRLLFQNSFTEEYPNLNKPACEKTGNYTCSECDAKFDKNHELTHHLRNTHNMDKFRCSVCSQTFELTSPTVYQLHLAKHFPPVYQCDKCELKFYRLYNLKMHKRRQHKELAGCAFQCDICSKTFISKSKLEEHMNTHTGAKPFICDKCGKGFQNDSNRRNHFKNAHKDAKDFFTTHRDKMFACHICEKDFMSDNQRKGHVKRYHSKDDAPVQ